MQSKSPWQQSAAGSGSGVVSPGKRCIDDGGAKAFMDGNPSRGEGLEVAGPQSRNVATGPTTPVDASPQEDAHLLADPHVREAMTGRIASPDDMSDRGRDDTAGKLSSGVDIALRGGV